MPTGISIPPSAAATGQDQAPPLAQLSEIELAARLEADHEEEERHQPAR